MPAKKQETAKSDKFGGKKAAAFGSGTKDKGGEDKKKTTRSTKSKER